METTEERVGGLRMLLINEADQTLIGQPILRIQIPVFLQHVKTLVLLSVCLQSPGTGSFFG